jgi:hypothetical protein
VGFTAVEDGTFWMDIVDFRERFSKVAICDRSTKNDLRLDSREDMPCCGPLWGCARGCAKFWCLCRSFNRPRPVATPTICGADTPTPTTDLPPAGGVRVIYCGAHATGELKSDDESCACVPVEVKDGIRGAAREVAREAAVVAHTANDAALATRAVFVAKAGTESV